MARPDFDPTDAVDFWHLVNRQDWSICENVQSGIAARVHERGWFSPMEDWNLASAATSPNGSGSTSRTRREEGRARARLLRVRPHACVVAECDAAERSQAGGGAGRRATGKGPDRPGRSDLGVRRDRAARVRSSKALADYAERKGFRVERGVAGMPTAFVATYGRGRPIIGIMGEYDALPGLSQKASRTGVR